MNRRSLFAALCSLPALLGLRAASPISLTPVAEDESGCIRPYKPYPPGAAGAAAYNLKLNEAATRKALKESLFRFAKETEERFRNLTIEQQEESRRLLGTGWREHWEAMVRRCFRDAEAA